MAQPDLHPDADLLNAFVEHALSGTERAQIVAHMAGCARCREVVYLAQAAANPEMTSQTAPAPARKSEPVPGWFSAAFARWRVALIPAAALAAVGSVVLWVQLHPRPTEMAQLASPRAESPAVVPPPTAQQPESRAADRKQAVEAPARSSSAKPGLSERPPAIAPKKTPAAADTGNALSEPTDQNRQPAEIHLDGRSAAMARYSPPQPVGASAASTYLPEQRPIVREAPDANGHPSAAFAARSSMVPAPSPAPPGVLAVQNGAVSPAVGGASQIAVQSLQQVDMVSQPTSGLPLLRLAKRAKLPSGLNTISSAVLLNRLVAVDSGGSVFLSQDGGRRWEPVFAQWAGKAVEVQAPSQGLYHLMSASEDRSRETPAAQASLSTSVPNSAKDAPAPPPAPSVMNSAPALAAKTKAAPPRPATLFKLVTDRHEVWVSADGKIWREQ